MEADWLTSAISSSPTPDAEPSSGKSVEQSFPIEVLPIVLYGHPVLRQKARPIPRITREVLRLIAAMEETLKRAGGIGLAAPQVGIPLRLFIVNTAPAGNKTALPNDPPVHRVMINPEIVWHSTETNEYEEGCLSIPEVYGVVRRPARLRLRYWTPRGEIREEEFGGLPARVIQHEYDHLEGKLFIDYLPSLARMRLRKTLKSIQKGQVSVSYAVCREVRLPEWARSLLAAVRQDAANRLQTVR